MHPLALNPVRILHVEDVEGDSELVARALAAHGLAVDIRNACTEEEFLSELQRPGLDVILSDYNLPAFDGFTALSLALKQQPDIPFIFVSGAMGEERAVGILKAGASDYVLKSNLARLGPAVERAVRDATQRREKVAVERALEDTRNRMRFALDAASVGVWDWDVASGRVTWSDLAETLHGLAAATFVGTFDAALECIHPDDRQMVREVLADTTPQAPTFRMEYRVAWPDGSIHWIAGSGRTIHDSEQTPIRSMGVFHDITPQRNLEEQLRQAQRLESIGGLAAGVAHDFNNLLTVINGFCEISIRRLAADLETVADLSEIKKAGLSAATLTRQLLAFSRRQILSPQVVDLNTVVGDTQNMMRRLVEANVQIDLRCAPDRLMVKVDPAQIEQVIVNLVVNARDAMPDGGVITIETDVAVLDDAYAQSHFEAVPGTYVRLTVSDTGAGISPEVQARLFEPFFTTKEKGRGTGLGLATVYGIVRQSGGHIWVYSELGLGTSFKLYFPLAPATEAADAPPPSVPVLAPGGETVLVVEDQGALRRMVARMLESSGYRVLLAATAEEARHICTHDSTPIDVVLTDVIMPGGGGRSLAKWVEESRPDARLLYMSGYSEIAIACHGVVESGTTLLQKPFTQEILLSKVREVLSRAPSTGARDGSMT